MPQKTRIIRQNAARPLGQAITKIMTKTLKRHGFQNAQHAKLAAHWTEILPAPPNAPPNASTPEHIRDGTLTIHALGGAATELQHLTPEIIARVNDFLGYQCVRRIKIVQRPQRDTPYSSE